MEDIIMTYEKVLSGELKTFPRGVWSPGSNNEEEYKKCLRYLAYDKLCMSREEIAKITQPFLLKYKLGGGFSSLFVGRMYEALSFCFPELKLKIWEMKRVISGLWSDEETRIRAIRFETIQVFGYDRNQIVENCNWYFYRGLGITKAIEYYGSVYEALRTSFPEFEFQPFEFTYDRPREDVVEILRHFVEDILGWGEDKIKSDLFLDIFEEHGYHKFMKHYFSGSPYQAMCELYPNKDWTVMKNSNRVNPRAIQKMSQYASTRVGELNPNHKLTNAQVEYIRSSSKSPDELSKELGCAPCTVRGVRLGHSRLQG